MYINPLVLLIGSAIAVAFLYLRQPVKVVEVEKEKFVDVFASALNKFERERAVELIRAIEADPQNTAKYRELIAHYTICLNNRGMMDGPETRELQRPLDGAATFVQGQGWTYPATVWNDYTEHGFGLSGDTGWSRKTEAIKEPTR
jgi:hypothetical protein